jgi:hypothetical protein
MIHPWIANQAVMPLLASTRWDVTFHGVPAHAAMAPHLGVNALDAVRLAFAGIDALRQQVRPDVRIHGIVTDGGDAPNVIPERAGMKLVARSGRRRLPARRPRTADRGRCSIDLHAGTGSSDIGNISQALPSLHGLLAIDDVAMPHTAPFEVAAGSPRGDAAVIDGAAVLAGIASELLGDPAFMADVRATFDAR